jgi:hypothetical protein
MRWQHIKNVSFDLLLLGCELLNVLGFFKKKLFLWYRSTAILLIIRLLKPHSSPANEEAMISDVYVLRREIMHMAQQSKESNT